MISYNESHGKGECSVCQKCLTDCFVILPPEPVIQELLSDPQFLKDITYPESRHGQEGFISDIYDGKAYKVRSISVSPSPVASPRGAVGVPNAGQLCI